MHDGARRVMEVRADDLTVAVDGTVLLAGVALRAAPGAFVGVVGPNGSGKTTLLRAVARALRPSDGTVHVGGDDVWRLRAREAAQRTAVVSQRGPDDFEFTVGELVALGRLPHKRLLDRDGADDEAIVAAALARVGMAQARDRTLGSLSGGERQRVLVAQALAQQPRVLVLDEPTNHLDIAAQLDVLELARGLGVTVLAALHDLNLAAAYCDHVVVLDRGRVAASGGPTDVLTPALIGDLFGVEVHAGTHPLTGRRFFAFGPRTPTEETHRDHPRPPSPGPDRDPRPAADGHRVRL